MRFPTRFEVNRYLAVGIYGGDALVVDLADEVPPEGLVVIPARPRVVARCDLFSDAEAIAEALQARHEAGRAHRWPDPP